MLRRFDEIMEFLSTCYPDLEIEFWSEQVAAVALLLLGSKREPLPPDMLQHFLTVTHSFKDKGKDRMVECALAYGCGKWRKVDEKALFGVECGKWRSYNSHGPWNRLLNCVSNDSRLQAIPQIDANGHVTITFEAGDEELAHSRIRFAVINANGKALFCQELILEKSERHDLWLAHWEGQLDVDVPVNLVFDVAPA